MKKGMLSKQQEKGECVGGEGREGVSPPQSDLQICVLEAGLRDCTLE